VPHSVLLSMLKAVWFALPAYIANASPVVLARVLKRRHPLDMGAKFVDGKRVLGDSKTIEGFVFGISMGFLTGLVQGMLVDGVWVHVLRGFVLGFGAMVGDSLGSFIKRRMGLRPGQPAPLLDQAMFIAVALLFAYMAKLYPLTMFQTIFLLVFTPVLHIVSNVFAYILKLKDVPW